MDWWETDASGCSIAGAADIIGDRWSLLIVRDAMNGVRRFDRFQHHLGISRAVLDERLARLVDAGILERRHYRPEGERRRTEYVLTPRGWGLQHVLIALMAWGDRFVVPDGQHLTEVRQRSTGAPLELRLVRSSDHTVVDDRDVATVPGPGARRPRPVPPR